MFRALEVNIVEYGSALMEFVWSVGRLGGWLAISREKYMTWLG